MPTPRTHDHDPQLGNETGGKAHWPLDLEVHPDKDDEHQDADTEVTKPLNPPSERRSTRRAEKDERPGS